MRFKDLLICLLFVIIPALYSQNATKAKNTQTQPAALSQSDGDSRLDSTLAEFYGIYASAYTFEDRIAQVEAANGGRKPQHIEIVKGMEDGFPQGVSASTRPANASPLLQREVANSDFIVMGVPLTSHTLPTVDRTFLFTEYQVRVDEVISRDSHNILPGDTVIVSRGGGELLVDGVLVKAIEPAFDQFQLDHKYLFILHAIPRTDTYRAFGSGTFAIENGTVMTASHLEADTEPKRNLDSFLSELSAAVARKRSGRN